MYMLPSRILEILLDKCNLSYYEICWRCDADEIEEERAIKNINYVL